MFGKHPPGVEQECSESFLPVALIDRRYTDFAQDVVDNQRVEVLPAGGVVIDRHRRHAELPSQRAHREILEADLAGESACSLDKLLRAERGRSTPRCEGSDSLRAETDARGMVVVTACSLRGLFLVCRTTIPFGVGPGERV